MSAVLDPINAKQHCQLRRRMPVCLHWREGFQARGRVCLLGSGLASGAGLCLDSGELLMSADRVRHSVMESQGPRAAISKQHVGCRTTPTFRNGQIWLRRRVPGSSWKRTWQNYRGC